MAVIILFDVAAVVLRLIPGPLSTGDNGKGNGRTDMPRLYKFALTIFSSIPIDRSS